jgi:glycosyltransferase involved in cell wall biosynthesis
VISPLISFIVPVYNAQHCLSSCVASLLSQKLEESSYEIILVNDGSTDGSYSLCRDLEERYLPIKVISQDNKGLSEARNVGISAANGAYLCFVDADDILAPGGVSSLLLFCNGNFDLIRFWCELVHPGTEPNEILSDGHVLFQGEGYEYLREYGLETFCWCYLYRRSFLIEKNLRFQPGIIGEDFAFMYDVMMARPTIISVASRIYQYNIVPNSISTKRSPEHSRRWVQDLIDTMKRTNLGLNPFREKDPLLYKKCRESLDAKMVSLFSRILSAKYTVTEYKSLLKELTSCGLLPLSSSQTSKREEWAKRFLAILIRFPTFYPAASFLFSRVFLPYVYPKIDRNG